MFKTRADKKTGTVPVFLAVALVLSICVALPLLGCGSRRPEPTPAKSSVLLITIDTLRADRVGGALTPSLSRLAAEGTTFTAMRAAVPLTLPSHATILTGMLPPEHGVRQNGAVRNPEASATLARVFHDAGYQTAAFVGAYVLDRRFGLADGFDTYDDRIPRNPEGPTRLESERPANDVVAAARSWLAGANKAKPMFLWVHFYDPHAPYAPPAEFLKAAGGLAYEGEVAFADSQAASLLADVRNATAGTTLIVAVAGDHGEGLGDHGEATHGMLAYDSTLRVPFIVSGSGVDAGKGVATPASLRDVAPTLLALAGLKVPSEMTGRDLLGSRAASDIYAETIYPDTAGWSPLRVVADDRWKLIASSSRELYDVVKDPGERQDVAASNAAVASAMASRADQIFGSARTSAQAVSGEAAERLRALGYVAASPTAPHAATNAPNPRDHISAWNRFEEALSLISAGRSAEALGPLRALASEHPDARVFHATCAQALKNTGRTRDALAIYRRLVARWPGDATLFHDLAVAAREVGHEQEALKAEQAALAVDSSDANAQNGLGLLHADAGRSLEATAAFHRATELDPNNATFWTNLANAQRAAGDVAAAEQSYKRAIDIDPRHADAANGIGVILVQQRRARDAVKWFEQAIQADPRLYEAQLNLGIAYQESGDRAKAAAQYRKVAASAPADAKEKRAARQLLAALR